MAGSMPGKAESCLRTTVLVEDADAERRGQDAGAAEDVRPRHRRAAQALDRAQAVERAAAHFAALEARGREVGLREVAVLEADRPQVSALEVALRQVAARERRALALRAGERGQVHTAVLEQRVADAPAGPL